MQTLELVVALHLKTVPASTDPGINVVFALGADARILKIEKKQLHNSLNFQLKCTPQGLI